MEELPFLIEQAEQLVNRLERVSVDSIWARRSSGHRGALLRWIEAYRQSQTGPAALDATAVERLAELIEAGYGFLERAARQHTG
jgi:hypothetical protein